MNSFCMLLLSTSVLLLLKEICLIEFFKRIFNGLCNGQLAQTIYFASPCYTKTCNRESNLKFICTILINLNIILRNLLRNTVLSFTLCSTNLHVHLSGPFNWLLIIIILFLVRYGWSSLFIYNCSCMFIFNISDFIIPQVDNYSNHRFVVCMLMLYYPQKRVIKYYETLKA